MDEAYTRVEDLWFPDGTLIIKAERKIFRVTKSILASRSSVFRDMAAFPQRAGDDESIDGCPVVLLHDSAADVEVFLRAIFDSSYFMPPPEPVYIYSALGILRLSHKYDVQYLFRRALRHLEVPLYFSSVGAFREPVSDHITYTVEGEVDTPRRFFAIIKAARETCAEGLLPVAYYRASQYPHDALLTGPSEQAEDAIKCVKAGLILARENATLAKNFTSVGSILCGTPTECSSARLLALDMYLSSVEGENDVFPVESWGHAEWGYLKEHGMCPACIRAYRTVHATAVEKVWERLPRIFDLPSWSELAEMKRVVMGGIGLG
ncbi:hypothetical protein DFH07DRAFT_928503 [Mycena maculata]|uniref:BTB domain-containing protein n=1 Tax=Mycena maculata TaxID=230809 RepID=A0AAD7I5E9_9AGAR|nr:hypothetical protein DFH07DRAFT_928503 [Mycena maculata]